MAQKLKPFTTCFICPPTPFAPLARMSATTETPAPAVQIPEIYDWVDLATSISCLAMDMMDLKEKIEAETDEAKKAEMQKELDRMETEYGEFFLIYEKTSPPEEDDESSYGWECDYENGQGCADW